MAMADEIPRADGAPEALDRPPFIARVFGDDLTRATIGVACYVAAAIAATAAGVMYRPAAGAAALAVYLTVAAWILVQAGDQ